MVRDRRLRSDEAERLLTGGSSATDDAALTAFVGAVRAQTTDAPAAESKAKHLSAIRAEAANLLGRAGARPAIASTRQAKRTRRRVLSAILSTLAAKIALGTVAAAAATGGLAATNSLPEPAQNAVSSAASTIGIDLPKKGAAAQEADQHGTKVSDTARTTEKTGREKGKEISETAKTNSETRRNDGDRGQSESKRQDEGKRPSGVPVGGPPATDSDPDGSEPPASGKAQTPPGFERSAPPSDRPAGNSPGGENTPPSRAPSAPRSGS